MPAVRLAVADRGHDARRLGRFKNDHDGIGGCPFEMGVDEVIAAACWSLGNRDIPLVRPSFQPALKLLGNIPQHVPAHRVKLPVGVEEADDAFRLLERLNQPVQQDAIKAPPWPLSPHSCRRLSGKPSCVTRSPPPGKSLTTITALSPWPLSPRSCRKPLLA
jgi:hypothetical protein